MVINCSVAKRKKNERSMRRGTWYEPGEMVQTSMVGIERMGCRINSKWLLK